jgi:hypothetical protein
MLAAIALVALGPLLATRLHADILGQKTRPCPLGSPYNQETWTLFKDDCSGRIYSVLVTCDGHVWMNVPPDWSVGTFGGGGYSPFPTGCWEMVDHADFTKPGEPSGFFLYNAYGQPVWFLNPRDAREQSEADAAYACTFGGTLN